MAWYKDLSPCDYFGIQTASFLRAVGWLSQGHSYTTGKASSHFFDKLCRLLVNPWEPDSSAGIHFCELCLFSGGNGILRYKEYEVRGVSGRCLFIPANNFIFVAPESIAHYIDSHGYLPPEDFVESVLACPEMRSMDYKKALLKSGGEKWHLLFSKQI